MSYISPFAPSGAYSQWDAIPEVPTTVYDALPSEPLETALFEPVLHQPARVSPTVEDWERRRPFIRRLYVDERMTLKDVAKVMATEHGHVATLKMYKDRIKKWRLDKKNKEGEMLAILRKNTERSAVGKSSSFQVRDRTVTIEEVLHYFKRKNAIRNQEAYNAPTPCDVCCRTPSPVPTSPSLEIHTQLAPANSSSWSDQLIQTEGTCLPDRATTFHGVEVNSMALHRAGSISGEEQIIQWTVNDMCRLMADEGEIPRSTSAPQTLLVSERLFFTVRTYMDSSFECGFWFIDEDGDCTVVRPISVEEFNSPTDFFDCCCVARGLLDKGLLTEFRRTLAKSFRFLETAIRIEHPRALDLIIEVMLMFKSEGRNDIVSLFLRYLPNISLVLHTKAHPWYQFWRLVDMLGEDELEQALIQSWQLTSDTFEKTLGAHNTSSVECKAGLMRRVSGGDLEFESHLRRLLAQQETDTSSSNDMILKIMYLLGRNLHLQRRFEEAEQLGLNILAQAEEQHWPGWKATALLLLAHSQYSQYKKSSGEKNLRLAIQIATDKWGMADPTVIEMMVHLEEWLRESGNDEEADSLKADIDEAIGRDETDLEMDGY